MKQTKDDVMEFDGEVLEQSRSFFKVRCSNGMDVLAKICGRMQNNHIRVLPGDKVTVEVSAYDVSRGRITQRHRQ